MKPFHFTPSAGPRLQKCLGAAVLPNVDEDWESAERGRALHGFMRALVLGKSRPEALALMPEAWRADAERMAPVEDVTSGRPEVGLALILETSGALLLGEDMTREQVRERKPVDSIGMLLDWLAVEPDTAVVRDWKTGWMEDLAPAAEHLQLRTYTAAALLATGKPYGRGELWHWDGVRWRVDAVTLDWLGAQEVLEEVRALLVRGNAARAAHAATGELPRLARGRWCAWCPAQRACPALTGGLVAVLRKEMPSRPVVELTPVELGEAYEALQLFMERGEAMLDDIKMLATRHQIPLPNGKVLRLQEVQRTSVDVEQAVPWLAKRYGDAVPHAAEKVTRSMSWESLADALRTKVLPGLQQAHAERRLPGRKPSLARLLDEARTGLEAVGAVRVSIHTQVKPCAAELPAGEESTDTA